MIHFLIDTLSHFPACFTACILSHLALRWYDKKKTGHTHDCCK